MGFQINRMTPKWQILYKVEKEMKMFE